LSEYLIDLILPKHEIHLLAGPTGAGKSRWMFQWLFAWSEGKPIFGHASHPVHWSYASADRTAISAKRTVDSMGVNSSKLNFIAAWDKGMTMSQIIDEAKQNGSEFLIIESFGSFVQHPATSNVVKSFLQAISRTIRDENLTILGVMESPKMKPSERYSNPRQRISGVASWGHFAETIMLVEPIPGKESTAQRNITVCPRNGPVIVQPAEFREDGHLHYIDPDL
jgi:RecA-family ATPase